MPEREVLTVIDHFEHGLGYLWFVFMAIWGGTASYITRVKKQSLPFSVVELFGEWTISGFSGLVTAYFCSMQGMGFYATAALSGIAGHMGGRFIFIVESYIRRKMDFLNK